MPKVKVGNYIKIRFMKDEPLYDGKIGRVIHIDDAGQIHGTWGGCALIPEEDSFEVFSETRSKLFKMCEDTNTSMTGINYLVDYYINSLGWKEHKAVTYALGLFHNGTIREIKLFGKDGKEL